MAAPGERHRNRISRRLFQQVLVLSLLLTTLFTGLQAWMEYRARMTAIQDTIEQIKNVQVEGIATALWGFDNQGLKAQVAGMLNFPYVSYAAIRDIDQKVIEGGTKKAEPIVSWEIPLLHLHDGRNILIGSLYVQADSTRVIHDVLLKIAVLFLFQAVFVAIVAFFLFLLFERQVTRHLFVAADYVCNFDVSGASAPLRLDKKLLNDEIDTLADAFNRMRENLAAAYHEQLLARQEVKESEERFKILFERAPDAIVVLDVDENRFVDANANAERLFGCDLEEIRRSGPQRFFSSPKPGARPFAESMRNPIERALAGEEMLFEQVLCNAGNQEILCEVRLVRLPSAECRLIRASYIDITERKRAESELRLHREHLESLVHERTAELTEAKDAAEAANRAKSLFLANMSHEIRTPMNAVLGFAEILQGQENDPQKAHFIDGIYTSGRALLNLINDILDFSKIEAGKLELQHGAISLSALFQEMTTIFGRKIADKGLIFTTEAAAELPAVLILDETRLRQVLINLLGNALKYTERGSILLAATCRFETSESRSRVDLTLRVTDTGIGISTAHQKLIFEAFEQVRGRNQNQYGGTGLGLAISKRLVELMGGTLSVVSDVGRGSTFTVFLPGVEVAAGSGAQAAAGPLGPESLTFAPATILIADDIDYNREILSHYLAGWSFRLLYAENGQEVLAQAANQHPDLILLDMKMPKMDGYACAEQLKSDPRLGKIPLVAVTASALKQDELTIARHCDGYLRKPVSRQELLREVMRFLPHTLRAQAEAAASPGSAVPAGEVLTPQRLAALPEECRRQLHTALLQLDVARINALIAEIAEQDPVLGVALNALAEFFAFDQLQALLAPELVNGGDGG